MKREEAIKWINDRMCYGRGTFTINHPPNFDECWEAGRMAIEALSKPNYETDTEVRLAVTDRNKDKVVLWDAFGEVEYYPCDKSETQFYDEDDYWNGRVPTHGRLIDADALSKKLCGTTIFIKDGEVFQRMINDAPTVQADRPHGEWICKGDYAECSECGGSSGTQYDGVEPIPRITAFCPHCGADMRKETE